MSWIVDRCEKSVKLTDSTYIIAEVGVNHNGSLERAKEMVGVAASVGVDAVKFQTFKAESLVTPDAEKADYQKQTTDSAESQLEMLKKLELTHHDFVELKACCEEHGVEFLSTPFDMESIDFLADLGLQKWKIPSGDITNLPYLRKIGTLQQEVILSTGMSDLEEVAAALNIIETAGTQREQIAVLHCTTEYPTPMRDVNLRAMNTMKQAFPGLKGVGYSDHTAGIEVPIAAVALGATVIEKHFTLNRTLPGPDHAASLEPHELAAMVVAIRNIENALGDGIKRPCESELKNRTIARKSIVAACDIKKGEILTEENLTTKRPATGCPPMQWESVIGSASVANIECGQKVSI